MYKFEENKKRVKIRNILFEKVEICKNLFENVDTRNNLFKKFENRKLEIQKNCIRKS